VLERAGALKKIGPERIYPTVAEGVAHHLRAEGDAEGMHALANSLALQLRDLERG
jgi:hypothetical protein